MPADTKAKWETIGPPPMGLFAREHVRAMSELAGFAARRRLRGSVPRGDGHAVLVLPGFLAGDFSTAPLRRFLRSLCYDARGWKLGVNLGPNAGLREALVARLTHLAERHGRRVSLIGWSLGGIYARELARAHPDRVRIVITLATPFRDISATHAARLSAQAGCRWAARPSSKPPCGAPCPSPSPPSTAERTGSSTGRDASSRRDRRARTSRCAAATPAWDSTPTRSRSSPIAWRRPRARGAPTGAPPVPEMRRRP